MSKPSTRPHPQPRGHRHIVPICTSKDLRMPFSFDRILWPEASVPLVGHNSGKTRPILS